PIQRLFPKAPVDELVPFGNQVVDGTARSHTADQLTGVAKRNTSIHAARALLAELPFREVFVELIPVLHPLQRRAILGKFPFVIHETSRFTHLPTILLTIQSTHAAFGMDPTTRSRIRQFS